MRKISEKKYSRKFSHTTDPIQGGAHKLQIRCDTGEGPPQVPTSGRGPCKKGRYINYFLLFPRKH